MADERWILDWQDISCDEDRRVLISVDSIEEFRERVKDILETEEWTPPDAHGTGGPGTISAYLAFQDAALDLTNDGAILGLWESVKFECDDGLFYVVRER